MTIVIPQRQRGQGNHGSEVLFAVVQGQRILVRLLSNNPNFLNNLNEVDMSVSMEGSNVKLVGIKWQGGGLPYTDVIFGIPANSAPAFLFTAQQTGNMEIDIDIARNMNIGASIEVLVM